MNTRISDEEFERLTGRVECYDLLTTEARRARKNEAELVEAISVGADRATAEPQIAPALFQRLALVAGSLVVNMIAPNAELRATR